MFGWHLVNLTPLSSYPVESFTVQKQSSKKSILCLILEYQKDVKRKQNKVWKGKYTRDLTVEPAAPNHTFETHARRDKGFKLFYVVRGRIPKVLETLLKVMINFQTFTQWTLLLYCNTINTTIT